MGISAAPRPDVRLDQRQLLHAAAAHGQRRQQLLQDVGRHDARLQVRRRLAADRHLLAQRSIRATASSPMRTRRPTSAAASIAKAPAPTAPSTELLLRRHDRAGSADARSRRPLRPAGRQGARRARRRPTRRSRTSCPGISFAGYEAPFTLERHHAARRHDLRARRGHARASSAPASAAMPDS